MKNNNFNDEECFPHNLPGIDIESGVKKVSGNESLYKKMLVIMQKQYDNAACRIRDSIANGDLDTALLVAHNLIGVSGNLAANELNASASKLENAIINRKVADFPDLLNKLETDLNQVFKSVEILNDISSEVGIITDETTELDIENVRLIMIELSSLIKKNSLDVDNCLEDLKLNLEGLKFLEEIKKLEDYLDTYDYDDAQSVLLQIAKDIDVSLEREEE
ncbi:MAG: Hpt domain-containing protein [Gammaproteobacteria bacterium]|nr:Hpt domain-containing protein [Gammaproteobacteria bacterium]